MNLKKIDFTKKLRENWFDSLKVGEEILIKNTKGSMVCIIINKDYKGKFVMVEETEGQMKWFHLSELNPVPGHMKTEIYKALIGSDVDE